MKFHFAFMFALVFPEAQAQIGGTLDSSFGANGKVITSIWNDQGGHSVALQTDGKIVIGVSQYGNGGGMVVRYNSDGSLDSSFGTAGLVYLDGNIAFVVIQSDNKICAATTWYSGIDRDFRVTRLNTDGSLDSTYGNAGIVITDINSENNDVRSIAIQNDDKILVTGPSFTSTAMVRYNTDGSLDTTFGTGGIVYTTLSSSFWSSIDYLAIQPDGKIVGAGYYSVGIDDAVFAVLRYNTDGSLDTSFGNAGMIFTQISNYWNFAEAIAIQTDGKIVVAGQVFNAFGYADFGLVRFNSDGSLDSTFGIGGKVLTILSAIDDYPYSLIIQPNGKIVVSGTSNIGSTITDSAYFTLAYYKVNGSLDSAIGNSGIVTTSFGSRADYAYASALQTDGKIVLVGETHLTQYNDIALARFISTLNVGIIDKEIRGFQQIIYPNPIANGALTLEYRLQRDDEITITLCDITGRSIITFIEKEKRVHGNYKDSFTLPQNLKDDIYLLQIKTSSYTTSVKLIIQK